MRAKRSKIALMSIKTLELETFTTSIYYCIVLDNTEDICMQNCLRVLKIVETDKCYTCNTEDNIPHFFVECSLVIKFGKYTYYCVEK